MLQRLSWLVLGLLVACGGTSLVGAGDGGNPLLDAGFVSDGGLDDDGGALPAELDGGPDDAGTTDGGASDAGASDAGASDAGVSDAGVSDAGVSDAGVSDAGVRSDGGLADGGLADGGLADGGLADGGLADGGARCPPEMVLAGTACVDRWEAATVEVLPDGGTAPHSPYYPVTNLTVRAVSAADQVPQGYISYTQARAACANAGKRLCTLTEWLRACRGPNSANSYPYGGTTRVRGNCNEGRAVHPVIQLFDAGLFDSVHMNDPRINQQPDTLARSGAFTRCRSPDGTYDQVGNLHEWIEDTGGTFKGGFYVDAEINGHGCLYTTTAHAGSYHDYSTGFRCCATPTP